MPDFTDFVDWCGETNTTHLVVRLQGETVVDRSLGLASDSPHDVGSIQKLLAGVVLAQLLTAGDVRLDQPIHDVIGAGWSNASPEHEGAITISHLATMTAGLDDDFRPIHEPGAGWYYCNNGYHLLRSALERVDGRPTDAMFRARIFEPCAMNTSSFALRDPDDPQSLPALITTGRDLARFGQALLEPEPFGVSAELIASQRRGTEPNPSYGHLTWVYGGETAIVPGHRAGQDVAPGRRSGGIHLERPISPATPADAFGGTGLGDQRLTMVPAAGLVIVRLGRFPDRPIGAYDQALWARIPEEFRAN